MIGCRNRKEDVVNPRGQAMLIRQTKRQMTGMDAFLPARGRTWTRRSIGELITEEVQKHEVRGHADLLQKVEQGDPIRILVVGPLPPVEAMHT